MDKFIDKNIDNILEAASKRAERSNHNWVNTAHLFLGLMEYIISKSTVRSFLFETENKSVMKYVLDKNIKDEDVVVETKDGFYTILGENTGIPSTETIKKISKIKSGEGDEEISGFANDFINILIKYQIDGLNFSKIFYNLNPKADKSPKDLDGLTLNQDAVSVMRALEANYQSTHQQQNIYDFVTYLFNDTRYELAQVFDILGCMHQNADVYNVRCPKSFNITEIYSAFVDLASTYKTKMTVRTLKDLDKIPQLTNLNKVVKSKPSNLYEIDETIDRIEIQLNSSEYPCLVLVGRSGVGKTAVVYELAQRINEGNVSERLKDKVIYELNINDIVANSKFRGDFEQRCKVIFEACKKNRDAIIFIDEGHMIASAGAGRGDDGGDLSLGNILKPYISRGDVTIITATTDGEYKHFEKDKALCGRFLKVAVQEPKRNVIEKIVNGVIANKEREYRIRVKDKDTLIEYILDEGPKFMPNEANPKRSLKLLDGAFAYASKNNQKELTSEDLKKYLVSQYNVTISDNKAEETRKHLLKEILGQTDAIERICENLESVELGLVDPDKPLYSMILAGPSGTGKTMAAKAIAKYFFGNENSLVNIDMSQYKEAHSVSNLIGAAKGYVGYNDEPLLISKVKQNPNCVVIFDEIEKAHPDIFSIFLRILDEGELDDAHGNKVSFKNTIIIFTTNLGFSHETARPAGAGLIKETIGTANALPAIKKAFKPEFLARINDTIVYKYLPASIVEELIYRATREQLSRAKIKTEIKYTPEEIQKISDAAKVPQEGARNISKQVQRFLTKKLIEERRKSQCTI